MSIILAVFFLFALVLFASRNADMCPPNDPTPRELPLFVGLKG